MHHAHCQYGHPLHLLPRTWNVAGCQSKLVHVARSLPLKLRPLMCMMVWPGPATMASKLATELSQRERT